MLPVVMSMDADNREYNDFKHLILTTLNTHKTLTFNEIGILTYPQFQDIRTLRDHSSNVRSLILRNLPQNKGGKFKRSIFNRREINNIQTAKKRKGQTEIWITRAGRERLRRLNAAKRIFGKYRLRAGQFQLLERNKTHGNYRLSQEAEEAILLVNAGTIPPLEYNKIYFFIKEWMERRESSQNHYQEA